MKESTGLSFEIYTDGDILENIEVCTRKSGKGVYDYIELFSKSLETLSPVNQKATYDFLVREINSNQYERRGFAMEIILWQKYEAGYESIYNLFNYLYSIEKTKAVWVSSNGIGTMPALELSQVAKILFEVRYKPLSSVYLEYITEFIKKVHNGSELILLVQFANVDPDWATENLAGYYSSVFEEGGERKEHLQKDHVISLLLKIVELKGVEAFYPFLQKLAQLNYAAYEFTSNLIRNFIDSEKAVTWGLSPSQSSILRSKLDLL